MASLYGMLGIVLALAGYKLFVSVQRKICFVDKIKKGNNAAAVVVAAFPLGISFIIGCAISSERPSELFVTGL